MGQLPKFNTENEDPTKLANLPNYKHPRMLCLALPPWREVSKIIRIFLIFFFIEEEEFRGIYFAKMIFL